MKTSVVAKSLAVSLMQTRALLDLLAQQIDNTINLAEALALDAVERESASAAAATPIDTGDDGPVVFGRSRAKRGTSEADVPVSPNAVGIVSADDTSTPKG